MFLCIKADDIPTCAVDEGSGEPTVVVDNVFSIDGANLPIFQKRKMTHLLGTMNTNFWAPDLDNPANKKFVPAFKKHYKGQVPAHYAAQAYDALNLIAAGIRAAKGDVSNMDAVRKGRNL